MPGNYLERVGTGIPFMLNQMRQAELPPPQFREQGEFVITLWNSVGSQPALGLVDPSSRYQTLNQSEQPVSPSASGPLSPSSATDITTRDQRQQLALEHVRQQGFITNREYQKLNDVSESTATRDLEILVERGSLQRTGRGPARRYVL